MTKKNRKFHPQKWNTCTCMYNCWLQSSEENDFNLRRTPNAPIWDDFNLLLQKELTWNVYNTKRSSTEWFILSILRNTERRRKVRTYFNTHAPKKGGKIKWQQLITVPNEHTGFRQVFQGFRPPGDLGPPRGQIPRDLAPPGAKSLGISPFLRAPL